jgi:hypothetical protein
MKLSLISSEGKSISEAEQSEEVFLAFKNRAYQQGERFRLTLEEDELPDFFWVQMDEAISPALIYLTKRFWDYPVIQNESLKRAYSPKVFSGERHYVRVWRATAEERHYRNLALNTHDQQQDTGAYPHAFANVETRDDATFFARNAIDGMLANDNHGSFPYQSWGINQQEDAQLTINFGRKVLVDKIALVLRADYPHDSFWTRVTINLDDDTFVLKTSKKSDRQQFAIPPTTTTKVTMKEMIKHQDDSPFPALTEIEVYGYEVQ